MTAVVLAVDGGNTKTRAVVASADGEVEVLGSARGGCSDIYGAASTEAALTVLESTCRRALDDAGVAADQLAASAFSLAGADWPEDFALLREELQRRLALPAAPLVVNDALGALRGGAPDWVGVAIVCGTGQAIGARRADGRIFHLGFWPDAAGGRQLGAEALRAVYRAELGLGPATMLTERALSRYATPGALELLHAFTRRGGRPRSDQDLLAPDVLDAADAGDAVARDIVEGHARIMGAQARATAQRAGLPLAGTTVVLTGGVFSHPSRRLADLTMAELPGARRAVAVAAPIVGATLLAFDRLEISIDAVAEGSVGWTASRSIA